MQLTSVQSCSFLMWHHVEMIYLKVLLLEGWCPVTREWGHGKEPHDSDGLWPWGLLPRHWDNRNLCLQDFSDMEIETRVHQCWSVGNERKQYVDAEITVMSHQGLSVSVRSCQGLLYWSLFLDDSSFLGCVRSATGSTSLLYTISSKMRMPFCQMCNRKVCSCYRIYKNAVEEDFAQTNPGEEKIHFWDKSLDKKNRTPQSKPVSYQERESHNQFGYNREKFVYPLTRYLVLREILIQDEIALPEKFYPRYDERIKCPHGHNFQIREAFNNQVRWGSKI